MGSDASLDDIENALAAHPRLGDPTTIRERAATFLELAVLTARDDEGARRLASALHRTEGEARSAILLHPIVRDAIASLGTALGSTWLDRAAAIVERDGALSVGEGPVLAAGGHTAQVLVRSEDLMVKRFEAMFDEAMKDDLGATSMTLRSPTEAETRRLDEGAALLSQIVPQLWISALAHVDVVAVMDRAGSSTATTMVESASWIRFPASVFLSPLALKSPLQTAESLLHEAIHHKHYDLRRSREIVAHDYDPDRAVTIVPPWNDASIDRWPSSRAASACHVYASLALFHARADSDIAATYVGRARHLVDELISRALADHGEDGRVLLHHLESCITAVERHVLTRR